MQRSRARFQTGYEFLITNLSLRLGGMVEQYVNCKFVFEIYVSKLNSKSLRSAYDVKAYVLLTAIRPSDGRVKPNKSWCFSKKSRLMSESGFPFTLPHLLFIIHTLHRSTILTHTYSRHHLNLRVINRSAIWPNKVVQKFENGFA